MDERLLGCVVMLGTMEYHQHLLLDMEDGDEDEEGVEDGDGIGDGDEDEECTTGMEVDIQLPMIGTVF